MYQKYHTEALVLATHERGEADLSLALYTREFGLVRARATAARTERSKMRYALQLYTLAHVSLIRGKRGWRLAGASADRLAKGDVRGIGVFARIAELTERLVAGEEKNEFLYASLAEAHHALTKKYGSQTAVFSTIEMVCVARVLFALGYISAEALQTALFTHTAYAEPHLAEADALREKLLASINSAIAETQL